MYQLLFNRVKRLIPKVSQTELIALRSGTTSVDREIYRGRVDIDALPEWTGDSSDRFVSLKKDVDGLLGKYQHTTVYPNPKVDTLLEDVSRARLFSLIIPDKFGGNRISTVELSRLLVYLTSANPSLGVTVMVPNSLGPGELLESYGTETQKAKYLPGLAKGEYIPCFGLTGPNNGSDATGTIDSGVLYRDRNGSRVIDITLDKRYITLAPVANLIGIAFELRDPEGLLEEGSPGVTVALVEKDLPGLNIGTHHNPLNVGFPNGTLKGKITISLDNIIGGESNAGTGWKMLMECLASGRAVSLPATALAASKIATYGVYQYARHRKQFRIPLLKMEGVSNKIAEMVFHSWLIECSVHLTNTLLDRGDRPAVLSAVMKYQTTERARTVVLEGMDIHGGSAICLGDSNFLEKFYRSAPIGITVEGSNTLTRNLIVFGQGLNKSHPYIFKILESVLDNKVTDFRQSFNGQLRYLCALYGRSLLPSTKPRLHRQIRDYALLSNFVALQGGRLKSNQSLSGDMADIFSNLYLAISVEWYHKHNTVSEVLTRYCVDRLLDENTVLINRVISNGKYYPLWHLRKGSCDTQYSSKRALIATLGDNPEIMETFKNDIYLRDNVLEKLERLETAVPDSPEYTSLLDSVIQVGEYQNN